MADSAAVELGAAELTGMLVEGEQEPATVASRSEAEEQAVSRDSGLDSGQKLVCQTEANTVEEVPAATTADADSTPEAKSNVEASAEPQVVPELQQVAEKATAATAAPVVAEAAADDAAPAAVFSAPTVPADAETAALEPEATPPGLPNEDNGAAGLLAKQTTPLSTDEEAAKVSEATAVEALGIAAETTAEATPGAKGTAPLEATSDAPKSRHNSCKDTVDEDGSEAGDSTGAGCTTESETTSCTGQTEEDITVRDDAVMHDVTAAQAQAASVLVEIASLEMNPTSAPEPEELRTLLLRLSDAHAGLERSLEDLQADSLAIMESNAELHAAIASTLRDLTQNRCGSTRTPREFAPSPEALLSIARNYWQQVKSGRLNSLIADQEGQSEQAAGEQPERPEWVARSQELGRQVRDQLKTLTSKVTIPTGSDPQPPQLAIKLAEQKQKLQEQLREHWSALATRTSTDTGKQVVEKSREIKKQLAEQLNPVHVQQATLQLHSQVLEGYQNISTRVSQDISEVISKLPWKQDASAAAAPSQGAIEEPVGGIFVDSNSASSTGATETAAPGVDELCTETTEGASAGQDKIVEANQLPFIDVLRKHITRGLSLGAAGEAKSAFALRNKQAKKKWRRAEEEAGDDKFTRVLVELELQLEGGKVATASLRTSDSRSRIASQLVHQNKLPPAVKRPIKAILKKAVTNAEKYPVQVSVTYAELLHPEEGL